MLFLLFTLPSAQAADANPAARWGHQAVYVNSSNEMYIVGGASTKDVTEVTNDVYILQLGDTATWSSGPNTGLPAHAFAAMAIADDTITLAGGMTSSCNSDAPVHTFKVGADTWSQFSPGGFIRRHGASAASTADGTMIIGGLVDKYVCSSGTSGYVAWDVLSSPSSEPKSKRMPYSLTGGKQAVSDFAMVSTGDKIYLAGGQSADGTLVPLSTIGVYSDGNWAPQMTTGSVPAGRLGATLVAHPTLDALILYGGATKVSSTSFGASSLVSVLNTTTWAWSIPENIQPSSADAVSYHSSVMTPQGVMITAFGRNNMGYPSTHLNYLDMRDPSGSAWAWTSEWSKEMNQKHIVAAIPSNESGHKSNKNTITAAVVPTVIGLLILIPLCVFLYRRHMRNRRHRRLTSHFDFATQEDRGDFSRRGANFGGYAFSNSFGSEGSLTSMSKRVMSVFRRGTKGVGDDGTIHEGEMVQVPPAQLTAKGSNWQEIDFGLGRVDAERRDGNYTDLPPRLTPRPSRSSSGTPAPDCIPFTMPIASTMRYPVEQPVEHAAENPFSDENQAAPALGELVRIDADSPRLGSPRTDGQMPLVQSQHSALAVAGADAAATEANDWNMLEQSMMASPVFKSSPPSTLRAHAHSNSVSSPRNANAPPSPALSHVSSVSSAPTLPPLQFSSPTATLRNVSGGARPASMSGNATSSRHLAGSGSPRRYSQQAPPPMSTRSRRDSVNALGLTRGSRLRVANPSEQADLN